MQYLTTEYYLNYRNLHKIKCKQRRTRHIHKGFVVNKQQLKKAAYNGNRIFYNGSLPHSLKTTNRPILRLMEFMKT